MKLFKVTLSIVQGIIEKSVIPMIENLLFVFYFKIILKYLHVARTIDVVEDTPKS